MEKAREVRCQTVVRVRPISTEEAGEPRGKYSALKIHPSNRKLTLVKDSSIEKEFEFGGIAHYKAINQATFFTQYCAGCVNDLFAGINTSIIACGQANTGKTHTMFGSKAAIEQIDSELHVDSGVVPRSIQAIFEYIKEKEHNTQFRITAVFMEICNEEIFDLFSERTATQVKIKEDQTQGVYVEGLIEKIVKSEEELLNAIKKGAMKRRILSAKIQTKSHAILQIFVEQRWMEKENDIAEVHHKKALMTLVDLASTEKIGKNKTKEEIKLSNKSLIALNNCINILTEKRQMKYVPYRESKLTRILIESLGGNSKTLYIACISPSVAKFEESLSTLMLVSTAGKIFTRPLINEDVKRSKKSSPNSKELTPSESSKNSAEVSVSSSSIKKSSEEKKNEMQIDNPEVPTFSFISPMKKQVPVTPRPNENALMEASRNRSQLPPTSRSIPPEKFQETMKKEGNFRDDGSRILKRLSHTIRYLQSEINKKNLVILRLREENAQLTKEESKAKSTDLSDTGSPAETGVYDALLNQIMSNTHMKAQLLERLESEGYLGSAKK